SSLFFVSFVSFVVHLLHPAARFRPEMRLNLPAIPEQWNSQGSHRHAGDPLLSRHMMVFTSTFHHPEPDGRPRQTPSRTSQPFPRRSTDSWPKPAATSLTFCSAVNSSARTNWPKPTTSPVGRGLNSRTPSPSSATSAHTSACRLWP